jgi:SAM-dependent methyltransferase
MIKIDAPDSATTRYNIIPLHYLGNSILEIGLNEDCLLESKLKTRILNSNYTGIDISYRNNCNLPYIQADILDYQFETQYETIIMMEFLEHLHFRDWNKVISKLQTALQPGGYFIVSVPYNEQLENYYQTVPGDYYQIHNVFGIKPKVMASFFPGAKIEILRNIVFRNPGENFLWASFRFFKRLIERKNNFPIKKTLIIFWQKGQEK